MEIPQTTPPEAFDVLRQHLDAVYLDVRTAPEFEAGHPAGARHEAPRRLPSGRTLAACVRALARRRVHGRHERPRWLRRRARPDGPRDHPRLARRRPPRRDGPGEFLTWRSASTRSTHGPATRARRISSAASVSPRTTRGSRATAPS